MCLIQNDSPIWVCLSRGDYNSFRLKFAELKGLNPWDIHLQFFSPTHSSLSHLVNLAPCIFFYFFLVLFFPFSTATHRSPAQWQAKSSTFRDLLRPQLNFPRVHGELDGFSGVDFPSTTPWKMWRWKKYHHTSEVGSDTTELQVPLSCWRTQEHLSGA